MEEKKKLKGFAAWTPERRKAAQAKARATREANKAKFHPANLATSASASEMREAARDPEKIGKLLGDGFKYTLNEKEQAIWEHDETISPLHVPKEISDKYPGMAWKWVSNRAIENRGAGYKGWQLFSDKSNPEGVKRGNDLRLAARPQSMSDSYRKHVEEQSSQNVRDVQQGAMAKMDNAPASRLAAGAAWTLAKSSATYSASPRTGRRTKSISLWGDSVTLPRYKCRTCPRQLPAADFVAGLRICRDCYLARMRSMMEDNGRTYQNFSDGSVGHCFECQAPFYTGDYLVRTWDTGAQHYAFICMGCSSKKYAKDSQYRNTPFAHQQGI
jgi:hypothetical protein